jgi:ribosomal protein S18 acetylase RimI-like enzyme
MEFVKADQLNFNPRPRMSRIFTEGFYQWLHYFSTDKEQLAQAFEHIFDLSRFFTAVHNNEIAAISACTDGKTPPVQLEKKILRRTLGLIRGSIAYTMLKKHLVEHSYPFELSPRTGSIEFVAAAPEYRGQGAAHGLIAHIMNVMPCTEYVLEVADTNTAAVRLYEKLGFREFKRVQNPAAKNSGFNFFVYMKTEAPSAS